MKKKKIRYICIVIPGILVAGAIVLAYAMGIFDKHGKKAAAPTMPSSIAQDSAKDHARYQAGRRQKASDVADAPQDSTKNETRQRTTNQVPASDSSTVPAAEAVLAVKPKPQPQPKPTRTQLPAATRLPGSTVVAPKPASRTSHVARSDVAPSATGTKRSPPDPMPPSVASGGQVAMLESDAPTTTTSRARRETSVREAKAFDSQSRSVTDMPPGRFFWNKPPPGFSDLAETQTSLVDIFFQERKLVTTLANFGPGWVRFERPREIAEKLPEGVDRDRITKALTGDLDSNSALLCVEPPKPGCGRLRPSVAGVIFDRDRFRADLFVNPVLLPLQSKSGAAYLPGPDSGFSALQSFAAVYSGGTVSREQYNVQSYTLLGVEKTRMRAYTGVSDADGFGVGTLVAEHERRDQIYRGGLYRSSPVPVLGDRPFYGAGYTSTYKARLDLEQVRGSELVVFLPRPAQVDVFREGRLISSQSFEGGNQILDTTTFPSGAYDLLLRIKESGGSVREETRFFAKSDQIPPIKAPRYVIEAGVLGGTAQDPFPKADAAPLLHAGTTHRILDEVAVGGDLAVSTETAALSAEAFYLMPFVTLSLGGFGALDESAGVRFNAFGRLNSFSYGFGARYFLTGNRTNDLSLTSTTASGFTQLDLSLGYAFANGPRIGFRGFWRTMDVGAETYSYGPNLYWTVFRRRQMRVDLVSDATFSNTESLAMARLRFSYDDRTTHFDASAGYRGALSSDSTTGQGLLASGNGEWRKKDFLDGELRLGGGAETQPSADVARASAQYIGQRGQINSFVQQDINNNYDTRYGGNLLFNVLGNSESVTMGGAYAYPSAIIVSVEGEAEAEFQVLVNGQPKGRIVVGQTLPIMLPDYKTYRVRLKAVGAPAIAYDTRTRRVSLYPATVKTLRWIAQPIVTLFARIVDADGQPIQDARVEGGTETSYTDRNGYFQVDLARVTELRVVRRGWNDCAVTFRAMPREKEFVSGKTLVCRWLTAEKRAAGGGKQGTDRPN